MKLDIFLSVVLYEKNDIKKYRKISCIFILTLHVKLEIRHVSTVNDLGTSTGTHTTILSSAALKYFLKVIKFILILLLERFFCIIFQVIVYV